MAPEIIPIRLHDASDRRVIEEELDINVVVVASAGTGKTEALIRRMVAAVVSGAVDIDALVAITFTRMAAGEMRARFAERLREAAASNERASQALRRIDRCFVGTIHSFCARILRERPLEAGLRPDFSEVDEHEVTVLWRHFWQDALQQLYADGDTRIDDLRRLGINVGDLYEFFVTRSENSDLSLRPGLLDQPDLDAPLMAVQREIKSVTDKLGDAIPHSRDVFLDQVDRADHYLLNRGVRDVSDKAELLKIYRRGLKGITNKAWPDPELAKEFRNNVVPGLLADVIEPALTLWRQYVYAQVVPLMEDLVEQFAAYRRQSGQVTYHDLLVYTARLLKTRPDVRRFFQKKFEAFFVDEFQDTDPLQAEIIMYLSARETSHEDWRRLVPDPGRLFVVGDEKQSIYRFRRADIDVFRSVRDGILESGGKLVRLQTSFRSQAPLCAWLNSSFGKLFAEHDGAHQAEYDELISARARSEEICVQKITIAKVVQNAESSVTAQEADRIARYILSQTSGPSAPRSAGDFMILTRRRKYLNVYASALEREGIPYDVVGGDSLSNSEELGAIVQMVEVVRRPSDEVAMLGFLRGPLVGLGDDELYALRKAGGRFRQSRLVPEGLTDELQARLTEARDVLDRTRDDLMLLSPSAALRSILEWTGLLAFSVGLEGGATRAGNLMRVLSLVRSWEEKGMNWSEIMAELQAVVADRKYQYEQMTLDVGRSDVVRVMNLHQAKGLQSPVVVLADPYEKNHPDPSQHISRFEGQDRLSIPITASRGIYSETVAEPIGWTADLERERKYAVAEELRNVYVAATRARDLLIVSKYTGQKEKGPWCRLNPMLAAVPEVTTPVALAKSTVVREMRNVEEVTAAIQEDWDEAAVPTMEVHTATEEDPALQVEDFPGGGRGTDYGSVFHLLAQTLIEKRAAHVDSYARYYAEAFGIQQHAEQLVLEIGLLTKSELWRELEGATRVYSEVPFAYRIDDHNVLRGTIDLVYLTDTGWKIVDFKTHHAETPESIEALKKRYAAQLQTYANAWAEIIGESVVEASLWLTESGTMVPLIH